MPEAKFERTARLAVTVNDWLGVLDLHAAWAARAENAATLPPAGAARALVTAYIQLFLIEDARDLARAARRAYPHNPAFGRQECVALRRLGDFAAAAALGAEEWRQGRPAGMLSVTEALLAAHDLQECHRFLEEAGGAADDAARVVLTKCRASLLAAGGDMAGALKEITTLDGRVHAAEFETLLTRYARMAGDTALLERQFAKAIDWSTDPAQELLFHEVAPGIIAAYYQHMLRWSAVAPLVEQLAGQELSLSPLRRLAGAADAAGYYAIARDILARGVTRFPSAIGAWRDYLRLVSIGKDSALGDRIRNEMKALFPPRIYLAAMRLSDPRTWDMNDISDLIADNTSRGGDRIFVGLLGRLQLDDSQLAALQAGARDQPPAIALQIELLAVAARDRAMIVERTLRVGDFSAFENNRRDARERLVAAIARLPNSDDWSASENLIAHCLRLLVGIEGKADSSCLCTWASYADAVMLAGRIIDCIRHGRPASFLRVSDGEALFLPWHPWGAPQTTADQAYIQNIWWGDTRMAGERLATINADFLTAVSRASAVGIMSFAGCIHALLGGFGGSAYGRGMLNCHSHFDSVATEAVLTSADFHHDLNAWGLWSDILGATRSVSYISCHDLAPALLQGFGVQTRIAHHIPAEHKYGDVFGRKPDPGASGHTLLDRHDELSAALSPLPGELYLVAAGFLGKIYCERIRERGGIAIDIGSLADYWMGFATRRHRSDSSILASTPNLLMPNHPLAVPTDTDRIVGGPTAVRSTGNFRFNIADSTDRQSFAGSARIRRALRVIGHPRCASNYMAHLFAEQQVEIGHERLLRDGISSWMHAVQDLNIPYGDNATCAVAFDRTVAHVRDPADAVPSIMLENGVGASFNFRRLHILRATGTDLAALENAVERAVASLVHWYDIVMAQQPEAIFRVEDGAGPVQAYVARTDLRARYRGPTPPDWTPAPGQAAGPDDPDGEGMTEDRHNSSHRKFQHAKPVLTATDWQSLRPEMRERLSLYCDRFAYALPSDAWTG